MTIRSEFMAAAILASLLTGAAGCGDNTTASNDTSASPAATASMGAAEKAGKALDMAGQNVTNSAKDAAAETQQKIDNVKNGAKDAVAQTGQKLNNVGQEVKGVAAGVSQTTQQAMAPAVLTPKVKNALIASKQIDASKIDVDTLIDKKTVVLRGSVPSAEKKNIAAQIAAKALKDAQSAYSVTNQLTVAGEKS